MPRRLRRSSNRRPLARRETTWVRVMYEEQQTGVAQGFFLFELVSPGHYTPDFEQAGTFRQDTCTVVRCTGRVLIDPVLGLGDTAGIRYSSALIVMGDESAENTATADAADFFLHDAATFEQNSGRMNILHMWPFRDYSALFQDAIGFPGVPVSTINLPANVQFDFDVRQKRKLKTDEALWMLVTYDMTSFADPISVFGVLQASTLIMQ